MPSVFESLTGLLANGDTLDKLGGALGTDRGNTERAVQSAAPALLGGLADKANEPGGSRAIMDMLDSVEGTPQAGVGGLLNGNSDVGSGMLNGIFGSDRSALLSGLASRSGVGSGIIGKVLPMLAPLVMGMLAKRRAADGLDATGVSRLLAAEKTDLQQRGLLGSAQDETTVFNDRAAGTALGREVPTPTTPAGPTGGGFRWLWWLLGALALVVLAGWALAQCGGSDAADVVGDAADQVEETAEDVVDEAEEVVDDAADTAEDAVEEVEDAVDGDDGDAMADIQPDVDAALAASGIGDAGAAIDGGAVTLTGTADSEEAKAAAQSAVEAVAGVESVDNQIEVVAAAAEEEEAAEAEDTEEESDDASSGATINELLDLDPITFEVNSAEITAEGTAVLDKAVEFMTTNADVAVEIGGHTDSDGSDDSNLTLSQARADSVKAYLEANGVEGDRMTTKGYGEAEPKVENDTSENKAINRRIEFTIQ